MVLGIYFPELNQDTIQVLYDPHHWQSKSIEYVKQSNMEKFLVWNWFEFSLAPSKAYIIA